MNWERNRSARVVGMNQNVVAPNYSLNHKAGFEQRAQNLPAMDDRQSSSVHARRPRLRGESLEAHPMG
jgi:hypothetical protein